MKKISFILENIFHKSARERYALEQSEESIPEDVQKFFLNNKRKILEEILKKENKYDFFYGLILKLYSFTQKHGLRLSITHCRFILIFASIIITAILSTCTLFILHSKDIFTFRETIETSAITIFVSFGIILSYILIPKVYHYTIKIKPDIAEFQRTARHSIIKLQKGAALSTVMVSSIIVIVVIPVSILFPGKLLSLLPELLKDNILCNKLINYPSNIIDNLTIDETAEIEYLLPIIVISNKHGRKIHINKEEKNQANNRYSSHTTHVNISEDLELAQNIAHTLYKRILESNNALSAFLQPVESRFQIVIGLSKNDDYKQLTVKLVASKDGKTLLKNTSKFQKITGESILKFKGIIAQNRPPVRFRSGVRRSNYPTTTTKESGFEKAAKADKPKPPETLPKKVIAPAVETRLIEIAKEINRRLNETSQ